MTRIVDALVALGHVTRSKDDRDGRITYITATPQGQKLLIQGRERRVRALAKQIAALDPRQQKALREATDILKEVIDAI